MTNNFVKLLNGHAEIIAEKVAYQYLHRGEFLNGSLTYGELRSNVEAIASRLQYLQLENKQVILLIRDSLSFIENFLACLYAKAVPVPVSIPSPNRSMENLKNIVVNSKASAVISSKKDKELFGLIANTAPSQPQWITTETHYLESYYFKNVDIKPDDIAFIQYTSGSTGTPKGVMVTHRNLIENERLIKRAMHLHRDSVIINWLPTYHDMGLIGNILQPLYLGATCITMLPSAFVQKPYRWLKAVTDFKGSVTGAPNFAFDLCVSRISEEQKAQLDLSSLEVTFTGSEPVRAKTLKDFSNCFASCGFKEKSFFPCYGMAESTLFISGFDKTEAPKILSLQQEQLKNKKIIPANDGDNVINMVSCGSLEEGVDVAIVDPESQQLVTDQVGEIWVKGKSVAKGYFDNVAATNAVFKNQIDDRKGNYLRTGDLGFLMEGELYISGRCKDLIIVRGKNYYPNDVEQTSSQVHSSIVSNGVAAFSAEVNGQEELILVIELDKDAFKCNALSDIRKKVSKSIIEHHDVSAFDIVFIKRGQLPRTTSGKLKRYFCNSMYSQNTFHEMQQLAHCSVNVVKANVSNYEENRDGIKI